MENLQARLERFKKCPMIKKTEFINNIRINSRNTQNISCKTKLQMSISDLNSELSKNRKNRSIRTQ